MLAGRISPSGAVMSSGNWVSTAAELLALAMYVFLAYWLLMKLVEWLARKTARRKRNKPEEDESVPHHRNYGTRRDGKKSGRQFWRRGWYERRYPEWERWNGKQTDYVGGMFHEIGIGGFRAVYCMDYYPKNKYPDSALSSEKVRAREFLLGMKDGRFWEKSADILEHYLLGHFWKDELTGWAVCYIPASSAEKTRQRFARLDSHVRMRTGIRGGLDWIRVTRDRSPTREGSKQDDTTWNLFFDAEKIRGRRIVLVDDITTRGMSFVQCARKLKDYGAVEVVGFFFGKSVR